jgi:hypothetical protein
MQHVRLAQAGTIRKQEETTMWRSTAAITISLALSLLATAPVADAQLPGKKIPRIGYLQDTSPSVDPHRHEAFLQGLRALGWVADRWTQIFT